MTQDLDFSGNFGKVFGEFDGLVLGVQKVVRFHQPIVAQRAKAMAEAEAHSLTLQRRRADALRDLEGIENGAKTVTAAELQEARAQVDWLALEVKRAADGYAVAYKAWHEAEQASRLAVSNARSDVLQRWQNTIAQAEDYLRAETVRAG